MGDVGGVLGSEKHVMNFCVEESCFFIYVNWNGLKANRYE
jgi:hypothetical protein